MPSRKDIEEFSRAIDGLGSEEEAPEKKDAAAKKTPTEEELGLSEPLGPLDFDTGSEDTTPPSGKEGSQEEPSGLDFTSLFGEEAASAFEGASETLPPPEPGMGEPKPAGEAAEEAAEEAELGPEPDLSSLSSDVEQMEMIPGEPGPLEGISEPGFEGQAAEEIAPGRGEPGAGAYSEGQAPAGAAETTPQETPAPEGLDASSFFGPPEEGVSFEKPEEALSSFTPPEPAQAEAPEMPSPGEPAAPAPSGIELPSFDEMNIAQEEEALGKGPAQGPAAGGPAPSAGEEIFFPEGLELGEETGPKAEEVPEAGEGKARDELSLDEFSLPESIKEFGIPPKAAGVPPKPSRGAFTEPKVNEEAVEELAALELDITLTDDQFARLRTCLASLPRNLKIAVQDIIAAGRGSGHDLKKLVGLLASGAPPREIAALAGSITGTRIRLPAGVEKKSGMAFEAEQRTFGYAFRQNILPIVRVFSLTAIGFALFIFLGYRYMYLPISSFMTYRTGYEHLEGNRFQLANQSFDRATSIWPMKTWFYRYAEGFAEKLQYLQAEEKYQQLLKRWPGDKKGILDYAGMKSARQGDYQEANKLLQQLLDKNMWDYDALLAAGDNALEWGAEDPKHLEEARVDYASLIERYGERDALLFRMLRYFVRTDKKAEADRLREYFSSRKETKVDPVAYAEYGGYLIDKNDLTYVQDVLFAALGVKPNLALIHYNLARYYRLMRDPGEERKALTAAISNMKPTDIMNEARIAMEVDSHTRMGELDYSTQVYLEAESQYKAAISVVEAAQERKLIDKGTIFGLPYYDLGDFDFYYGGDLDGALVQYVKAAANGFVSRDMDYKVGYIHYVHGDYQSALNSFLAAFEAGSPARTPVNLLYALGNTFYKRDDVFMAQGYFLDLAGVLNDRKAGIKNLQPQEQSDQRSLVELLMKVNNNLGVTTMRIADKMGDKRKRSEALAYLASAAEEYDVLSRDPETLVRPESKNLPNLNMRGILYPASGFVPQIYNLIPKDMEALFF